MSHPARYEVRVLYPHGEKVTEPCHRLYDAQAAYHRLKADAAQKGFHGTLLELIEVIAAEVLPEQHLG